MKYISCNDDGAKNLEALNAWAVAKRGKYFPISAFSQHILGSSTCRSGCLPIMDPVPSQAT